MEEEEKSEELVGAEATRFRVTAARANYLAADRPDIQSGFGWGPGLRRGPTKPTDGVIVLVFYC